MADEQTIAECRALLRDKEIEWRVSPFVFLKPSRDVLQERLRTVRFWKNLRITNLLFFIACAYVCLPAVPYHYIAMVFVLTVFTSFFYISYTAIAVGTGLFYALCSCFVPEMEVRLLTSIVLLLLTWNKIIYMWCNNKLLLELKDDDRLTVIFVECGALNTSSPTAIAYINVYYPKYAEVLTKPFQKVSKEFVDRIALDNVSS